MVGTPDFVCEFEPWLTRLGMLHQALCGSRVGLAAIDEPMSGADGGETVWLPSHAPVDTAHGLTPFAWYQVSVVHRALHAMLNSYELDCRRLQREIPDFDLQQRQGNDNRDGLDADIPAWRFVQRFDHTALAVSLFVTIEDARIDAAATRLLPGLTDAYRLACHEALHDRPPLTMLTARDALVEALTQLSLGAVGVFGPPALDRPLARIAAATLGVRQPGATATDSAFATLQVYDTILMVSERARYRSGRLVRFADLISPGTSDQATIGLMALTEQWGRVTRASGDHVRVTFYPVLFRDAVSREYIAGDMAPDLPVRHTAMRLATGAQAPPEAPVDDAGSTTSDSSLPEGPDVGGGQQTHGQPAPVSLEPDVSDGAAQFGSRLDAHGPNEFVYPEWDTFAHRYREKWCRVCVSRALHSASTRRARAAMFRHKSLVPGVLHAVERVQSAGPDIVRREPDGVDLDLDACIDAFVDRRAGIEPSDRVFVATRERRRDVAVAFAIDLSASTAEVLPPLPDAPGLVQSVLDVERDSVRLLVDALDRVGDIYGVYGFSGSARDNVRITVVKDLDERRSPGLLGRLEGLTADHTTRMGAMIRHLTDRLGRTAAATKVLLILSDGRPFDIDYGQRYGEQATVSYALADTGRALDEARDRRIHPYLVTVDRGGADYLSRICAPREYHVISDARQLPRSLAHLYAVARQDALRVHRHVSVESRAA